VRWKRPAGAGATPTAATSAVDTPPACKPNPNLKIPFLTVSKKNTIIYKQALREH